MPIRIEFHPEPPLVEAVYSGPLRAGELGAASREITATARRCGTRLRLADLTALTDSLSIVDLYDLADALARERAGYSIREALVLPDLPSLGEAVRFWQTTCSNHGLNVRVFRDRASALEWLLETPTASN